VAVLMDRRARTGHALAHLREVRRLRVRHRRDAIVEVVAVGLPRVVVLHTGAIRFAEGERVEGEGALVGAGGRRAFFRRRYLAGLASPVAARARAIVGVSTATLRDGAKKKCARAQAQTQQGHRRGKLHRSCLLKAVLHWPRECGANSLSSSPFRMTESFG